MNVIRVVVQVPNIPSPRLRGRVRVGGDPSTVPLPLSPSRKGRGDLLIRWHLCRIPRRTSSTPKGNAGISAPVSTGILRHAMRKTSVHLRMRALRLPCNRGPFVRDKPFDNLRTSPGRYTVAPGFMPCGEPICVTRHRIGCSWVLELDNGSPPRQAAPERHHEHMVIL